MSIQKRIYEILDEKGGISLEEMTAVYKARFGEDLNPSTASVYRYSYRKVNPEITFKAKDGEGRDELLDELLTSFIDEECLEGESFFVRKRSFSRAFNERLRERGHGEISPRRITYRVRRLGYGTTDSAEGRYMGFTLKPELAEKYLTEEEVIRFKRSERIEDLRGKDAGSREACKRLSCDLTVDRFRLEAPELEEMGVEAEDVEAVIRKIEVFLYQRNKYRQPRIKIGAALVIAADIPVQEAADLSGSSSPAVRSLCRLLGFEMTGSLGWGEVLAFECGECGLRLERRVAFPVSRRCPECGEGLLECKGVKSKKG